MQVASGATSNAAGSEAPGGSGEPIGTPPGSVQAARVVMTVGGLQMLLALLYLARSKTIALLLGPEGVGVVSVVDQLVQLVTQVSALALSIAPIKFISRTLNRGAEEVSKIYQALFKSLLTSLLIGSAVSIVLVATRVQILGSKLVPYQTVVMIAILSVPTVALSGFFSNVLASTRGFRSSLVYVLFAAFANLVAAYVGIRMGGIPGLYYANLVVGVAAVVGVLGYVRTTLQLEPHSRGFRLREEFRKHSDIFAFCAVVYVLSFAQPLAFFIARFVVLQGRDAAEAGYFQAAFALAAAISMLLMQSIRVYLEPITNRDIPIAEKMRSANEFLRSFAVLILLGALPVVLFPREILILLYSSAFTPATGYLFMFVLSDCTLVIAQVYLVVLLGSDDLRGFLLTNLFAYVSLAALAWSLVPRFGLYGVACAFLFSRGALFLLVVGRVARKYGFRLPGGLAALLIYVLLGLSLAGALGRAETVPTLTSVLLRVTVLAAFTGGAWLFLNREERRWLRHAWQQLGGQ